jgi:alpha-galactosidase
MSIVYNNAAKTFTLNTRNTSYQMKIGNLDYLYHLYYGPLLPDGDLSYQIQQYDRGFSGNPYLSLEERTFSLDAQPQEFTTQQQGDFRVSSIEVVNGDGSYSFNGRVQSFGIWEGKYTLEGLPTAFAREEDTAQTLEITLEDPVTKVQVALLYAVLEEADVSPGPSASPTGGRRPFI